MLVERAASLSFEFDGLVVEGAAFTATEAMAGRAKSRIKSLGNSMVKSRSHLSTIFMDSARMVQRRDRKSKFRVVDLKRL